MYGMSNSNSLANFSDTIFTNPELGLEEHKAHALLTGELKTQGFSVEEKFALSTGFRLK